MGGERGKGEQKIEPNRPLLDLDFDRPAVARASNQATAIVDFACCA